MSTASGGPPKVPPSLRPGDTDDVLEGKRLNRIMVFGFVVVVFFAFFLPVYWFVEPTRMANKEAQFHEQSVDRGLRYFSLQQDPQTGEENFDAVECARCHGVDARGGTNDFLNPSTGTRTLVQVPGLRNLYAKFNANKESYGFPVIEDARQWVTETIERGRPGTDMPTWGSEYGGPLTAQQIDDIVNWLEEIQEPTPKMRTGDARKIFNETCATCHGVDGKGGGIAPAFAGGEASKRFPDREEHVKFVIGGSVANQLYGDGGQGTGRMPPRGGFPELTDQQIAQIVDYERSL